MDASPVVCTIDDVDAPTLAVALDAPAGLVDVDAGDAIPLIVTSTRDDAVAVTVELTITTPFGQSRAQVALEGALAPHGLAAVAVPRRALGPDTLADFPTSGVVAITLRATTLDGADVVEHVRERLSFHPEGALVVVYDAAVRDAVFNGGALTAATDVAAGEVMGPYDTIALAFASPTGTRSDEEEP